jgi:hypothetical protein
MEQDKTRHTYSKRERKESKKEIENVRGRKSERIWGKRERGRKRESENV